MDPGIAWHSGAEGSRPSPLSRRSQLTVQGRAAGTLRSRLPSRTPVRRRSGDNFGGRGAIKKLWPVYY